MKTPLDDTKVFRLAITVLEEHIDDLEHVNNIVYLKWVQEIAAAHWEHVASQALRNQCAWVVLRHEIDYVHSAIKDERIEAITWVESPVGLKQCRCTSIQRVDDRKVLAYAESTWCLLDPVTGRPKRISEEISNLFRLKEGS